MEVIRYQSIGQDPYAAKGLQPSHQEHKSFGLWGPVAGGLENELTVDHSGNAVVKTLTLSLDARESHGREADYTEQKIKVWRVSAFGCCGDCEGCGFCDCSTAFAAIGVLSKMSHEIPTIGKIGWCRSGTISDKLN